MKTSYKLLSAAVILILTSLAVYNSLLIKTYNISKDPYYYYDKLKFKDFKTINIQAGYVQIIQGPFAVHINKDARRFTQVELNGKELKFTKSDFLDRRISPSRYDIIISCPDFESLMMDAKIVRKDSTSTILYSYISDEYNVNMVDVSNFNLDSLSILQDNSNLVSLKNNKIGKLKAELGTTKGAGSVLKLDSTNQIQQADIDVREASKLILDNIAIPKINSKFSSTARASITGKSIQMLKLSK